MAAVQIHLPNDLIANAGAHWMRTGHHSLQGYVIHLIREDLRRSSGSESKSTAEHPRKGKASFNSVRPASLARGKKKHRAVHEPIHKIRKRLLDGMVSHMKATEDPGYGYACGYQMKQIDRLAAIIDAFLAQLRAAPKARPEIVIKATQRAVVKLNKLNSSCGRALIETDQREDLCKLISTAVAAKGVATKGDITEAWREW